MRQIKLLVIALMLAFAGVVYAAGSQQETKQSCGADKAGCCAQKSECCKKSDGASCCKSHHQMGNQQTAGAQDKKNACCDNAECCKDGKSCCGAEGCKMDKTGKAAGCCDSGKNECCAGGGSACCTKDKAKKG